ncbi:hypothetical protein ES288_D11G239500v1 [Gossypium darwinii]|uniref:Large ribosomal subunit protein uL2 C-terminal domain-containing protein n=1 Tax=Gossypium darwinii TaxID=34276 RepID=A0A5D2AP10_GOSDA|nr:hypothetical protein ES288_D11G239500v1 [Gossypium darwinii]
MAIHLYKTSTPGTRNRAVDNQVKSNLRNNLIYGQHRYGKGRNARGIITARHRGGGHKHLYILHPRGAIIGDTIVSGTKVPIKMGNALPLSARRIESSTTVGHVGNVGVNQKSLGRAGSKCWLGKRQVVRGVVMNPVDHHHGGGEGRAPIGRKKPATYWGCPALGRRSRNRNKYSDNLILRRRSK